MRLPMMLLFALVVSGCAKINGAQYCDTASPLYFSEETLAWLVKNDRQFLTDTVVANEQWNALCR
jgi:hypothetical protein